MYRSATDFFIVLLYLATLPNELMMSKSLVFFLWWSFQGDIYKIIIIIIIIIIILLLPSLFEYILSLFPVMLLEVGIPVLY
jgi:hypothetical protein